MPVDLDELFQNMLAAASSQIKEAGSTAQTYLKTIMENHEQILTQLAQARLDGQIDDDTLQQQLSAEKEALESELLGMQVIAKEAAQNAINAAIQVLLNTIKAAI